jgi:hypothetical protein
MLVQSVFGLVSPRLVAKELSVAETSSGVAEEMRW